MILYHGTTEERAKTIFIDGCLKKDVERYFTKEKNGDGYTMQGYVYLTNEITFATFFANSHNLVDKGEKLYVFRFDIPDGLLEADCDELRCQHASDEEINRYGSELHCSLLEYKACRVPFDISIADYKCSYCIINVSDYDTIGDLFDYAGYNYEYVIQNYTDKQKEFIQSIIWEKVK